MRVISARFASPETLRIRPAFINSAKPTPRTMCDFLCGPGDTLTDEEKAAQADVPVWLHVYDVGHAKIIHKLDVVLKDFLHVGGVFHGAVEVYGKEWSFGGTRKNVSGVFGAPPKGCRMHT